MALRDRFETDLVIGQGPEIRLLLPESDLAIWIGLPDTYDADFVEAVEQKCIDLVSIVLRDETESSIDSAYTATLHLTVSASSLDADIQALLSQIDHRLTRMSDARHEYNNIAAVVGLTSNPAMLERAREALRMLRETYPEYCADPDNLDEKLGLKSSS
ncbi:MAG: hypothetical protein KC519_20150 [Anaerolineae bacterium]|nr:hypothetical protein [Anaerolineae bacterium]